MGAAFDFDKIPVMIDRKDKGESDSLRYRVISMVQQQNYEMAITDLKNFLIRPSEYPTLKVRTERYINHAVDLVRAIEMKSHFPGMDRLTQARQQDLKMKTKQHVDELVYCLKKIETIQLSIKQEDFRSTILIIRSVVLSGFAIAVLAFLLDLTRGLLLNSVVVADDVFAQITEFLFKHF
jgi:hypothetical protein